MSELKVEIRKMKLADLNPAEYNPRRISDEAFGGLGTSISRFGMLAHIVWNERSGNIVGGHQRYRHLVEHGEAETDVVVVNLDDNEEVALNITLNNRQVRGDFTKDVMDQLRLSEVQLGSAFKQLGLLDLFAYLQGRGFDRKQREKTTTAKTGSDADKSSGGNKDDDGDKDDPPDDGGKAQAYLLCPKCQSQWKLADNEVVFNAVTGTGNRVGGK